MGGGRFRLRRLLRGREGTSAASHSEGEPFVLIERGALEVINLPVWVPGVPVRASTPGGIAQCALMPAFDGLGPRRPKLKL